MKNILSLLVEFSVPLIAGVIIALIWVNLAPEHYHAFVDKPFAETHPFGPLSFRFIANEIFMVFFFGMAMVEITQSCLPGGDLNPPLKIMNPILATLGGVIGPVFIYLFLNDLFGSPELTRGWPIPIATDIIIAWLVARVVFGRKHPAIPFLLLLAFADDAVGLAVINIFHPAEGVPTAPRWLLLTVGGMAAAWLLRKSKVMSYWPYLVLGGGLSWVGLFKANMHPALALVFIVPFFPSGGREQDHLFEADRADRSALTNFELEWKNMVEIGLFLFGLANAGMELSAISIVTWLVLISLVVGKTGGIFLMSYLGEKIGFPLPEKIGKRELLLVGMIAGIGLTVALIMASAVFRDKSLEGAAKMGALLSGVLAVSAIVLGRLLKVEKVD